MVQVLPRLTPRPDTWANVGNTLAKFGEVAANAQQIGQERKAFSEQKKSDQAILEGIRSNPNLREIDIIAELGKLSSEAQKANQPYFQQLLKGRQDFAQKAALQEAELQAKSQANEQKTQIVRSNFNRLRQLIPETGKTFGSVTGYNKVFNRQQLQDREEFDKRGFLMADSAYTHLNKGTITDAKLQLIKEDLAPRANLSERENLARIDALQGILGLPEDASEDQVDRILDQAKRKEKSGKSEKRSLEEIFQ